MVRRGVAGEAEIVGQQLGRGSSALHLLGHWNGPGEKAVLSVRPNVLSRTRRGNPAESH